MFSCIYYHGPHHACGGGRRKKRNAVGPDPTWISDHANSNAAPAVGQSKEIRVPSKNHAPGAHNRRKRRFKLPGAATIAIIGLDKAGKSTVLLSLQNGHVQNALPTLGFVHDEIKFKRCWMTVYDLGGSEKIRAIWPNYYAEAHGFMFVVDAAARDRLPEARACLARVMQHAFVTGKRVLVLINKVEVDGAMPKAEVLRGLHVAEADAASTSRMPEHPPAAAGTTSEAHHAHPPTDAVAGDTHASTSDTHASTGDADASASDAHASALGSSPTTTQESESIVDDIAPQRVLVEVCSAIQSKPRRPDHGIKFGVRKLLDAIQRQGSSLTDRREHDLVVHREHMATEQAARRERVRQRREERERAKAAATDPKSQDTIAPSDAPASSENDATEAPTGTASSNPPPRISPGTSEPDDPEVTVGALHPPTAWGSPTAPLPLRSQGHSNTQPAATADIETTLQNKERDGTEQQQPSHDTLTASATDIETTLQNKEQDGTEQQPRLSDASSEQLAHAPHASPGVPRAAPPHALQAVGNGDAGAVASSARPSDIDGIDAAPYSRRHESGKSAFKKVKRNQVVPLP